MQILIFTGLLVAGGFLNFITKLNAKTVNKLATAYLCLALTVSAVSWLLFFAAIKNIFLSRSLSFILDAGNLLGRLIAGYLIINILFTLTSTAAHDQPEKKTIRLTLLAASILTANTFLLFTIGKAENMGYMSSFFTTSGYAIWFLYFIMIAETLGGLGILFHFKLKTGPFAAAGLMLIMIGALYTHCHNKDPFSDSYDAIAQFVSLALLQTIYYFEQIVFEKI